MKSMKVRILLYFLLLSIISLFIVGYSSYSISVATVRSNANDTMQRTAEQIGKNIFDVIKKVEKYTYLIFTNERIQEILMEQNQSDKETPALYTLYKELDRILSYYFYEDDYLLSATIQMPSHTYIFNNIVANTKTVYRQIDWQDQSTRMAGNFQWMGPSWTSDEQGSRRVSSYVVSRLLKDIKNKAPLKTIGVLNLLFSERILSDTYQNFYTVEGSKVFVVNSNGEVISHSEQDMIAVDLSAEAYMKQVLNSDQGVTTELNDGVRSYIAHYRIPGLGWHVIEIIPHSYVTAQIRSIVMVTLLVCLACLLVVYILSLYLANSLIRPLKELNGAMKKVENGNFAVTLPIITQDEVGQLLHHFNRMVRRIQSLFEQTIKQERDKKKEELRALQYQINPHFLYNTLNSIRLMAMLTHSTQVQLMVEALIRLLRNTIGKYGEQVRISVELQNLKDYMMIHSFRYNDEIKVSYEVDESLLDYKIPHFILQPIVENALVHGLEEAQGEGELIIRVYKTEDDLIFQLEDNGVGMTEEQIQDVLNKGTKGDRFNGIGIKNVDDRIKLNFGHEYGVEIDSQVGIGTKVQIRLPIFSREEGTTHALDLDH